MTAAELKAITEDTVADTVSVKGAHLQFGRTYAPVLATTNLASREAVVNKLRELRGNDKSGFDANDWDLIFGEENGRFTNVFFNTVIPPALRFAPSGNDGRALHRSCAKCCTKLWKFCVQHHCCPQIYSANDIHADSDAEIDDADLEIEPAEREYFDDRLKKIPELVSLKTKAEKKKYLLAGTMWKKFKRHRMQSENADAEEQVERPDKYVKLSKKEREKIAADRAAEPTGTKTSNTAKKSKKNDKA